MKKKNELLRNTMVVILSLPLLVALLIVVMYPISGIFIPVRKDGLTALLLITNFGFVITSIISLFKGFDIDEMEHVNNKGHYVLYTIFILFILTILIWIK